MAVAVEVGGDAALAADRRGPRRSRSVTSVKRPPHVAEQPARGQAAGREPLVALVLRVAVDDVEVEPAVAVVVEPAEAAADHRHRVDGDAVAERAVPEAQAALARRRRGTRARRRAPHASSSGSRCAPSSRPASTTTAAAVPATSDPESGERRGLTRHRRRPVRASRTSR